VVGELDPEAEAEVAILDARIVRAGSGADSVLRGFQRSNFAVARAAAEALIGPLDETAVLRAASTVDVPGRFQVMAEEPLTIFDGAHNPSGVAALASALSEAIEERPLVAVVSVLDDKDAAGMLSALLPLCAGAVFTTSRNPRALSPATLASLAAQLDGLSPPARGGRSLAPEIESDPRRAVARAQELAGSGGAVVATGSIYLVADLLSDPGRRAASAL
jgi:dihydrofolate synthase/folylpolyglutamate synthase